MPFVIYSNFFDIFAVLLGAVCGKGKQYTKPTAAKYEFVIDVRVDLTKEVPELIVIISGKPALTKAWASEVKYMFEYSIRKRAFLRIRIIITQSFSLIF